MALNTQMSDAAVNAEADALAVLLNNGYLRIYDGTQAATADTAVGAQVLLAELRFNATAFAAAVSGVLTANAITGANAVATIVATFYRVYAANHTSVLFDGSVGTSLCNLNLLTTSLVSGQPVNVTGFTFAAQETE